MFCRFLFVILTIVLSVLRYKDSDYPFGIFKLFLYISCFPHDIVIQICIYFIPPPTQKKLLTHSLYLGRVEFFLSFPERWSCNTCLFFYRLSKLQKGCTRLTAASDNVYQLLAYGRWFSPGTLASSTTKNGRHDIAEILPRVALNTKNQIKSNMFFYFSKWSILVCTCIRFVPFKVFIFCHLQLIKWIQKNMERSFQPLLWTAM